LNSIIGHGIEGITYHVLPLSKAGSLGYL